MDAYDRPADEDLPNEKLQCADCLGPVIYSLNTGKFYHAEPSEVPELRTIVRNLRARDTDSTGSPEQ